ncbi:MAG: Chemotaxis protein CheC -- inhibitor of MCP methylation [uncultured Paraburkholderia sp.]|nr:MAG: Chemotaxis protein CheC -- inhibitor of MCP methylation [uncultured Paraburkholderia sp.]
MLAMSLPIVIADDSLLARKVLTKALPADWDVEVSYASNGREALALYRQGKEISATRCKRSPIWRWVKPRRASHGCSIRSSSCRCRA